MQFIVGINIFKAFKNLPVGYYHGSFSLKYVKLGLSLTFLFLLLLKS